MKYAVLLCDGMADYPVEALGGKTPMEAAFKPHMDALAKTAEVGLCQTVQKGMKPGSDVANLSVMGYDPADCYTGRSPLEAAGLGIALEETDVTLRCNLVTLSEEEDFAQKRMLDYCAGDISSAEAAKILQSVEAAFGSETYRFYSGVSYRHCLVVRQGTTDLGELTPPHDISDRVIGPYLSRAENARPLIEMMRHSCDLLKDHPVNRARVAAGKHPANAIWLWGEGKRPALENFQAKNGVSAGVVSAVDLIRGIGVLAGMRVAKVEGATGYIDTNFEGKAAAAAEMLQTGCDLVYLHVEAPDECGHRGETDNKVRAIEQIDARILPTLLAALRECGDFRLLILPDHPTPLSTRTHAGDPVPYLLFDSRTEETGVDRFCEKTAEKTGVLVSHGPDIMKKLLQGGAA